MYRPCYSIIGIFWSLCLSVVSLYAALYIVAKRCIKALRLYRIRIGMKGRHFDWYHFRPPTPILIPQLGAHIMFVCLSGKKSHTLMFIESTGKIWSWKQCVFRMLHFQILLLIWRDNQQFRETNVTEMDLDLLLFSGYDSHLLLISLQALIGSCAEDASNSLANDTNIRMISLFDNEEVRQLDSTRY